MRRGAMLDLLTNKEGLVGNVMLKGCFGCRDPEIVEFKILRAMRRVQSKLTILDFRIADFGFLRDLLVRSLGSSAQTSASLEHLEMVHKPEPLPANRDSPVPIEKNNALGGPQNDTS
ncbi:pecanex-like protein hypothetical protein [Limosa lapponica baueri]|uniref:Uncharacterized protein n=1 Tax=Limosa lapponica baueri TaxID=1758121 RepID=A0A2I0U0V6_LIMLA|nr:pecanex-like protein hypothetical protein [Limosa lapponica baueri]